MPERELRAAYQLEGRILDGGWRVVQRLERLPGATGGFFSVGYVVQSADGKRAFLKALDFSSALEAVDPARELEFLTAEFNFERQVLATCKDARMDRVVVAIEGGICRVEGVPYPVVQYLIFELADGDVRRFLDLSAALDVAWALRSLHHTAVGLHQLHTHFIAHQDLKPSNVLTFRGKESKIADLGRAARQGFSPPHDELTIPGDVSYAPPELLYNHVLPDWRARRIGCDLYLFGSLILFYFTRVSMTAAMTARLHLSLRWTNWSGDYREILPHLREAFDQVIDAFALELPSDLRNELPAMVRELCDPDPVLRGDATATLRGIARQSLVRYVSRLNRLATQAEYGLKKVVSR